MQSTSKQFTCTKLSLSAQERYEDITVDGTKKTSDKLQLY